MHVRYSKIKGLEILQIDILILQDVRSTTYPLVRQKLATLAGFLFPLLITILLFAPKGIYYNYRRAIPNLVNQDRFYLRVAFSMVLLSGGLYPC
jgi:hypothetical protein